MLEFFRQVYIEECIDSAEQEASSIERAVANERRNAWRKTSRKCQSIPVGVLLSRSGAIRYLIKRTRKYEEDRKLNLKIKWLELQGYLAQIEKMERHKKYLSEKLSLDEFNAFIKFFTGRLTSPFNFDADAARRFTAERLVAASKQNVKGRRVDDDGSLSR